MGTIDKNGRPKKFDECKLLQVVVDYIENEHEPNKPIKITKLAKGLKDTGLNIVYQDLNRYKKVKEYIQEYNIKLNLKIHNNSANNTSYMEKKRGGRPRKFKEDELLIAVKGYIKNQKIPELIKTSRLAKDFQDKGINVTYQDLNRYSKVREFIDRYNAKYKEILFAGIVEVDIENQKDIFKHIDINDFLKRNKTQKDIENALLALNKSNEKLVESNDKLQNKIIFQNEKIITQRNEIDDLKAKIGLLEMKIKKHEDKLDIENKKLKNKISKDAKRFAIYDEFINRYHYANLAEYAICLEQRIHVDGIKQIDGFIDKEKYAQGNFSLMDIADKYLYFQLAVENTMDNYLNDEEDIYSFENIFKSIDILTNSEEVIDNISSMNLSMDDLDSSLSIIDDI